MPWARFCEDTLASRCCWACLLKTRVLEFQLPDEPFRPVLLLLTAAVLIYRWLADWETR